MAEVKIKPLEREIVLSEATEQEHYKLLDFLLSKYPDLGWSRQFLEWQYHNNPAGIAKCFMGWYDGKVIAGVTAIPHIIYLNGTLAKAWRVQDVITHPDFQGRGLYGKLSDELYKFLHRTIFPLNFTFPNENSHPGFIKRNWIAANRVPLWVLNNIALPSANVHTVSTEPLHEFTSREEQIWNSFRKSIRYAIDRNCNYLNWRYFKNPRGGYHPFRVLYEGRSAVCIFKIYENNKKERFSHIVDLFYEKGFGNVGAITRFFIQFSAEKGAVMASAWSQPRAELAKELKEHGFKLNEGITRWHVLNINTETTKEPQQETDFSNWHISMGDSDVY